MNLEKKSVRYTFLTFLFPTVASSLILSVISLTDLVVAGYFVGEIALSAISLALPVVIYVQILCAFFGMGGAILLSVQMGQGNREQCNRIFTTAFLSAVVISVFSAVAGLLLLDPLLRLLGAGGGELWNQARGYISVLVAGIPFMTLSPVMLIYLRNDNEQQYAKLCVLVSGIVNLAASVFLITVADMGTAGIACGSVIAELLCCLMAARRLFDRKRMFRIIKMKPDICIFLQILNPGFALAVIFLAQVILTIVVNHRLGQFGREEGTAIYAVIKYLINFMFAFFDGINGSMQPMLGIYYGEREKEHVKTTAACGAMAMTVIAGVMFFMMTFGGSVFCSLFSITGDHMVKESVYALRVMALFCPVTAFVTYLNGFYRCTGKTAVAFMISIADNLLFPVCSVLICSKIWGMRGVWSGLLAGGICTCILILCICAIMKQGLLMMKDEDYRRPENEFSRMYSAEKEILPEIISDVEQYGESVGIGFKKMYMIDLIIEELVVNTVNLADGKGRVPYVDVRITPIDGDRVTVRIRDNLTQLDLTDSGIGDLNMLIERYQEDGSIDYKRINELGIGMIKKIASEYSYRRTIGYNNFLVTI